MLYLESGDAVPEDTFVYLIHLPGVFYKIGFSYRPERRFVEVRSEAYRIHGWVAWRMVLVAYARGDRRLEARIHWSLRRLRVEGHERYAELPIVPKAFNYFTGLKCIANASPTEMSKESIRAELYLDRLNRSA